MPGKHSANWATSPAYDSTKLKICPSASTGPKFLLAGFNKIPDSSLSYQVPFPRNNRKIAWRWNIGLGSVVLFFILTCWPSVGLQRLALVALCSLTVWVSVGYRLSGLLWLDAEGGNAFSRFKITCFFPHFSSQIQGLFGWSIFPYWHHLLCKGQPLLFQNHSGSWKETTGFFAGYTCVT